MLSSEEEIWKVQLSCLSSLEQKIDEKVQLFSLLYFFFVLLLFKLLRFLLILRFYTNMIVIIRNLK